MDVHMYSCIGLRSGDLQASKVIELVMWPATNQHRREQKPCWFYQTIRDLNQYIVDSGSQWNSLVYGAITFNMASQNQIIYL